MKQILAAIVCIAVGLGAGWILGPSIWSDYQLEAASLQPASEYQVTSARCRQRIFIIASCDIEFEHVSTGGKKEFDYLMLGRMGGTQVYALKTPDGQQITTNVGIDSIINRVLMLVAIGGVMVLLGVAVLYRKVTG